MIFIFFQALLVIICIITFTQYNMKGENQKQAKVPLLGFNPTTVVKNDFKNSGMLPVEIIQTLGDNSCPYIKKKNIFDFVAGITAKFTVIRPENRWLLAWHVFIMMILLYYIFEIGLLWGYGVQVWIDELAVFYTLNFLFIIALIIDCFLSTIKAYYSHGLLVTHPRLIVKRYLKIRFYIDILAIISVMVPFISQNFGLNWIKALFFLKIYSVYEIDREFIRVSQLKITYHTFYLLSRLMMLLVLGSHYLGIWFYMIDYWIYENNYYGPNTPNICWIYNANSYPQLVLLQPWYGQYLYTMYFSIGTMTTIAYGDITPLNPLETAYITFTLVIYTLGFAYILSEILRILMEAQASKFQHSNNLLVVSNMMKNNNIKQKTQSKVKSYFEKVWKEQIYRNRDVENELIQKLPHRIRNELFSELYYSFFISSGFFYPASQQTVRTNFIVALANEIREQRLVEDHVLYKEGEEYDPENLNNHIFYFIKELKKGKLKPSIEIGVKDIVLQTVKDGNVGLESFFTGEPRDHWAKIVLSVLVYELPRKVLMDKMHLATEKELQNIFLIRETIENRKCYICNHLGHNFKKCEFVTYQPNKIALIRYNKLKEKQIQKNWQSNKNKIKRKKREFNTRKMYKQIKDTKYKLKSKYEMIKMDKYYRQLFQSQSQRKIEKKMNREVEYLTGSPPKVLSRFGSREDDSFGMDESILESREDLSILSNSGVKIYRKSSISSSGSSFGSDSSNDSSVDLDNYLKETQLYIRHLQNFESDETQQNMYDHEQDIAKNFQIYYPFHNIKNMIRSFNKKPTIQEQSDELELPNNPPNGPSPIGRMVARSLSYLFGVNVNNNQSSKKNTARDLLLNESVQDQDRKEHSTPMEEERMMSEY